MILSNSNNKPVASMAYIYLARKLFRLAGWGDLGADYMTNFSPG